LVFGLRTGTGGRRILAMFAGATLMAGIPATAEAAQRHVSSGAADSGACTLPCGSVAYAAQQAQSGDVIHVAGGQYGAQRVPSSAPSGIEIRAAAGARPSMSRLEIEGSGVTVRGFSHNQLDITDATGVTVVDGTGTGVYIHNSRDVTLLRGSYGGNADEPTVFIADGPPSVGVTFDGVDFHDSIATNSTVHTECLWIAGVQRFTVRNSLFRNCAYFDIFFTKINGVDPKDVLLESNVFEVTKQWNGQNAPYAVNVSNHLSRMENFVMRNNTFGGDVAMQPGEVIGSRMVGNVGGIASCKDGVTYAYNIWTRADCSATDTRNGSVMSGFANPAAHDWRLLAGSPAVDAASPTDFPARDRSGKARVGRADAGAHEYGNPPPATPPPAGGSGPPTQPSSAAVRARVVRKRVCKRPRRGCPRTTRLRIRVGSPARVTVRLRRITKRGTRTVSRRARSINARTSFRLDARRLRRGRYRIVVNGRTGSGAVLAADRVRLRVLR
jgi:hypothetical protein